MRPAAEARARSARRSLAARGPQVQDLERAAVLGDLVLHLVDNAHAADPRVRSILSLPSTTECGESVGVESGEGMGDGQKAGRLASVHSARSSRLRH